MAFISEVAEGIYQIKPKERRFGTFDCFAYIVVGQQMAVIETGSTAQAPVVLEGLRQLGYEATSLSYIIPTHVHVDHGGGAGYLAQQLPQAQVVVHRQGARHLIDPSRLIKATRQTLGNNFEDELGPILPVPEGQLYTVQGGESIPLGNRELRIIYSPGHAPHHICIYEPKSQGLFCGDALGVYLPESKSIVPAWPPGLDLDLALDSIGKLRELAPQTLFYSHYGVSQEVARLIGAIESLTREWGQIALEAMKSGKSSDKLARRMEAPFQGIPPHEFESAAQLVALSIAGFMAYFRGKNIV